MRVVLAMTARQPGGVWRHVADLAGGLRARGVAVILGLDPLATGLVEAAENRGLDWLPLGDSVRTRCDVWHLHVHDTYEVRVSRLIVSRARRPARRIVTEHLPHTNASDPLLRPGPRRFGSYSAKTAFKKAQYALLHQVIAVSDESRAFLLRRYRVPARRISVVHNGVAGERRVPTRTEHRPMRVLCAGSLIVQKGFETLVEARTRAETDWRVDIAGEGPARPRLEALARRAAPGSVRLLGWRDDVNALMAEADAMCLPSLWEAAPYAALDAMSAGLPVVASAVDGLPEILAGGAGVLVPPEDPAALAAALDALAADPAARRRVADEGLRRVAAHFTLEGMLDGTLDVYRAGAR